MEGFPGLVPYVIAVAAITWKSYLPGGMCGSSRQCGVCGFESEFDIVVARLHGGVLGRLVAGTKRGNALHVARDYPMKLPLNFVAQPSRRLLQFLKYRRVTLGLCLRQSLMGTSAPQTSSVQPVEIS